MKKSLFLLLILLGLVNASVFAFEHMEGQVKNGISVMCREDGKGCIPLSYYIQSNMFGFNPFSSFLGTPGLYDPYQINNSGRGMDAPYMQSTGNFTGFAPTAFR